MRVNPAGLKYVHIPTGDVYDAIGMAANFGEILEPNRCCDFKWKEQDRVILKRTTDEDAIFWMISIKELWKNDIWKPTK